MKTPTNDSYDNDSPATSSPTNLGKRKGRPLKQRGQDTTNAVADEVNFLDDESDLSFDEYMDTSDNESSMKKQRGRGTSKTKDSVPLPMLDEESDLDEAGESKVDKDGHLLEGREYKVPTFELPNRGHTLFMFSKDPAALLNFRDSFVFIKKNPKLVKVYITDDEKSYLVETNKLRSTFRTREVSVVSARSVFKVFGHRVVKKGRRGRDDYYFTGDYDENEPIPDSDDDLQQQQQQHQHQHPQLQQQQPLLLQQQQRLEADKLLGATGSATGWPSMHQAALTTNMLQPSLVTVGSVDGQSLVTATQQSSLVGDGSGLTNTTIKQINVPISLKPTLEPLNTYNWLHHTAVSVRDFGAQLHAYRKNNVTFYDLHTNVYQLPCTQQTTSKSQQSSSV